VPPGTFLRAYAGNRTEAQEVALESYPIAVALRSLVDPRTGGRWEGLASDLLAQLAEKTDETTRQTREWPKASNALSRQLRRLQPNLRTAGIDANWTRTKVGTRWTLQNIVTDRHSDGDGAGTPNPVDDIGDEVTVGDDPARNIVTAAPFCGARSDDVAMSDDILQTSVNEGAHCPACGRRYVMLLNGPRPCDCGEIDG
jgi:hypothetical protein